MSKQFKYEFTRNAAAAGDLEELKAMIADGYPINKDIFEYAGESGKVEILEYLYNLDPETINEYCLLSAIEYKHYKAIDWLIDHGIHCSPEDAFEKCILQKDLHYLEYILSKGYTLPRDAQFVIKLAAGVGCLEILQWLHETKGYSLYSSTDSEVSLTVSIEYDFTYAGFGYCAALTAATNNNLDCLQYAYEKGCPWHPSTTKYIASIYQITGNEELEDDYEEDEEERQIEVKTSTLFDCFKFAVEHGCPIHPDTVCEALENNNLQILRYIQARDYPIRVSKMCIKNVAECEYVEAFTFCFEVCKDKESFWDTCYDVIINRLDFTLPSWRPLFNLTSLEKHEKLSKAVSLAREKVEKMRSISIQRLEVPIDIIKYKVNNYY